MAKKDELLQVVVDQHRIDPTAVTMDKLRDSGWSDDPGTGKAVLMPDERGNPAYEVLNPMPFAPPIGWEPTPPLDELIRQRVREEVERLRDDEEVDDIIDAEDFDVDDELPPLDTIYEVIAMKPEAPDIPKDAQPVSLEERAKMDVDYEEMVVKQRLLRKRHREAALKKAQEEARLYGDPPADGQEEEGGQ